MLSSQVYDIIVIGGGIAGSTYGNLMSRKGNRVLIIEKDEFPKHKVCGEYVSMESYDFMQRIGIPLDTFKLPKINTFSLSSQNGKKFTTELDLGGFGISRFLMDNELKKAAIEAGCEWVKDQVVKYTKSDSLYTVSTKSVVYQGKQVVGAWGKRSNLDRELDRSFYFNEKSRLTNWLGIKYHIKTDYPSDLISLHTFENGYCGISQIENDQFCLCYLMRSSNLLGKSIAEAEEVYLHQNPFLKSIFNNSEMLYERPLAISQVNFQPKSKSEGESLMLGDSAGLIAPLCGNGMSMAMHSALIASESEIKKQYQIKWESEFNERMRLGRFVQYIFGSNRLMASFVW